MQIDDHNKQFAALLGGIYNVISRYGSSPYVTVAALEFARAAVVSGIRRAFDEDGDDMSDLDDALGRIARGEEPE